MATLARQLRVVDYFTLGWGTMVGVGWLVIMDDWLLRGGVLGAVLGFAIGGALLLPIGYVYGQLVSAIPDASGEVAYTARVFPRPVSYATGWMMLLSYFIVCPWEAVAVGRIAAYIFPGLDTLPLYQIGGKPVFLPRLLIGLALTAFLTVLNYRGIRLAASFQNWTSFGTLALFVIFTTFGVAGGSAGNLPPLFTHSKFISILLVLQIVPYFMAGYDSVGKSAEEADPNFQRNGFFTAIATAIVVAGVFYCVVISAVAYAAPWKQLIGTHFLTAAAFQRATGSQWIVRLVLSAALLSLIKCFNGNFVASSRLLFAMSRRSLLSAQLSRVHPENQTPSTAVVSVGIATGLCMFLGDAILVPVTEVGSAASAMGWLAACCAFLKIGTASSGRIAAAIGACVAGTMVLMKIVPGIPGNFHSYEWLALLIWIVIGVVLVRRDTAVRLQAN